MARIGYARVSSPDQNIARQHEMLGTVDKMFDEIKSGKSADRPQLKACLGYLRPGDTLVVSSADRLGRSTLDNLQIVKELVARGVSVEFIGDRLEFKGGTVSQDGSIELDAHDTFRLSMLSAVAELERSLIRGRQREGIELKKQEGGYFKPPSITPEMLQEAREKIKTGVPKTVVAKSLGIGVRTLYRALSNEGVYSGNEWREKVDK